MIATPSRAYNEPPRLQAVFSGGPYWGQSTGAQLHVSIGGKTLVSWADGWAASERRMRCDTILPWSCCSKILTVIALARCLEAAGIDFDEPVASVVPEFGTHGKERVSFRHLATHTVPYRDIGTTTDAEGKPTTIPFMPWADALEAICAQRLRAAPGTMIVYTSFVSWHVLAEAVARLSGEPYMAYVAKLAADCGAHAVLPFLDDALVARYADRLGSFFAVDGGEVTPAPSDQPAERIRLRSAGTGARGSAADLARLLEVLRPEGEKAQRLGISRNTLAAIVAPSRVGLPDPLYDGEKVEWGFGVCADPRAFGLAADVPVAGVSGFRSSFGFVDLRNDVVIAYISNGCPPKALDFLRKLRIVRSAYVDIGLTDSLASEGVVS